MNARRGTKTASEIVEVLTHTTPMWSPPMTRVKELDIPEMVEERIENVLESNSDVDLMNRMFAERVVLIFL